MIEMHTPTPWRVLVGGPDERPGIEAESLSVVIWGVRDNEDAGVDGENPEQELANAEFIVRACNSYYDMIEALRFYSDHMKLGYGITDSGQVADAAIAKATGKDEP